MLNYEEFLKDIINIDVFDTHTHLKGSSLPAADFWSIAEYLWFLNELRVAGYYEGAEMLPEDERIEVFLKAFDATRNTSMNWVVRSIFKDLYNIEIKDAASVKAADEAVRKSSGNLNWAREVCDRLSIKKIVVNDENNEFYGLTDTSVCIPRLNNEISNWMHDIQTAENQKNAGETVKNSVKLLLGNFKNKGYKGVMFSIPCFSKSTYECSDVLKTNKNSEDDILVFLLMCISEAAQQQNMFIQLLIGMSYGWYHKIAPVNDPYNILHLYGLFEKYNCQFEIVLASDANNMDAVQAARLFPNVHIGGMWWMNFRVSTYRDSMQKRFESLPPSSNSLIVSDARCIEWCYGKILLVKRLIAEFLFSQVEQGWIDKDEAIRVAKGWLYDSAARRYGV